jgi:hypothetical protein
MTNRVFGVIFLGVLFLTYPAMARLHGVIGTVPLGLLSLMCLGMAAWLTPEVAARLEDLRGALRDVGLSQKAAAITAGVSEPTFANWMSGKERAIARLSDAVVIERGPMCELVNAVQVLTAERTRPRLSGVA